VKESCLAYFNFSWKTLVEKTADSLIRYDPNVVRYRSQKLTSCADRRPKS